jgi:hypothetical protein
MQEKHAWSGHSHHLFYFQAHIVLVTMDLACATGGFILTKRTLFQSPHSICTQRITFFAQPVSGAVSGMTIDSDHFAYDFLLSFVHLFSLNRSVKIAIFFLLAKQKMLISFSCSAVTPLTY